MSNDSVKMLITETDGLREMLNYIADRNQIEQSERKLNDFIAESFKRHLALIESYISTTNEIQQFIMLAGNEIRVNKIRQLLQKADIQSNDIVQQFELMFKYIDAKLTQSNCLSVSAMNEYENHLANLKVSLNQCELHQKNMESVNLVRKIRGRVDSLIEKIKNVEQKVPELMSQALDGVLHEDSNNSGNRADDSDEISALDDY
ncbi:uncharacterized protein LOC119075604 [Bradysia coprophila]|uniref:uncharacterized protein LOC119075604 n=1 Tax=Bradysia coprophila TaxID=38358 RepID=UPI00187D8775|nr:uncharacterized protein LOC119075604 [Bradysia coprophila]